MYDSKPKIRDGDPIESLVPQAIEETASRKRANNPQPRGWGLADRTPAFYIALSAALVEGVALVGLLIWC